MVKFASQCSRVVIIATLLYGTFVANAPAHETDKEKASQIDQLLAHELAFAQKNIELAPLTDDETFLRRVHLDLTGQLPEPADIKRFINSSDDDKRQKVVDRLLDDERFGKNWGQYWRDVIMFRRSEERGVIGAGPLGRFFEDALNANQSWDEIARACITAKGEINENGDAGLIIAHFGRPEETVSEISRVFMGIQIQCAQCHDHPTDDWTREQFHELVAFFPRTSVRPAASENSNRRTFQVSSSDRLPRFPRDNANNRFQGTSEHYMPDLDDPEARGKLMTPRFFVSGENLEIGTSDSQRRSTLAKWVTDQDNPWFARSFVNRIWAELVGEGFYEPVDDIGPERKPTAGQTLDFLAKEFTKSGYDVKNLYRLIIASEAYQRESRPRRDFTDTSFTANVSQPLRGDQLYDALFHAVGKPQQMSRRSSRRGRMGMQLDANGNAEDRIRRGFNARFGFDPSNDRSEISGTIPQALTLMNSPQVQRLISSRGGNAAQIARKHRDPGDAVDELYLQVMARYPTKSERNTCSLYIKNAPSPGEGIADIMWALVNSTEFVYRR